MFHNCKFSFTKHFKIFAVISLLLVIVGIIGLVCIPFGVYLFNFDIDFLGGTTMQFELYTDVNADVTANVENIVKDVTGAAPSSVIKAGDYVSASVGADLRNSAIIASAVAAVLILLYITIRFEFRSGIAAVIALVHDLLVMLSMYIIFQIPFNMNFIAAALTILGYSINATIVVFDRIRENRKLMPKEEFASVVDHSIWQTMNRSINTTVTTLLAIVLLLILGVSSIRNFALPLTIGILAGCYSSVCLSGSIWNKLRGKGHKQHA